MCNIFTQSIMEEVHPEEIDFNLCSHLIVLDKSFRNGKGILKNEFNLFL